MPRPLRPWTLLLLLVGLTLPAHAADPLRLELRERPQLASGLLPPELAARYSVYRVSPRPDSEGLRWVFTPRRSQGEIRTVLGPLPPAASYAAQVWLGGEQPQSVALGAQTYDGAWHWAEADRLTSRVWHELSVPGPPEPVRRLAVRLTGLQPGERYVLDLRSVEVREPGDLPAPAPLEPLPPLPPLTTDLTGPAPQIRLSGEPLAPVVLDLAEVNPADLPPGEDPRLYRVPATCAFDAYGRSADAWLAPEEYDFRDLDLTLAALLARDPQARVLLQVACDSPPWWEDRHPEALIPAPADPYDLMAERKLSHASWFTGAWREAAAASLTALVTHVEQSPWAPAVIGWELTGGRSGGWLPWHHAPQYQETAAPAQAAFRLWLQIKYQNLVELRSAWGQPRHPYEGSPEVKAGHILTQWAQIQAPTASVLLDANQPSLYDPAGQQDRADYQKFLGEWTAGILLELMAAGREAEQTPRLWGACYGHLLWWPDDSYPPSLSGQLGLGRLVTEPAVDFLTGLPGAEVFPSTALASLRLHGKLWLEHTADLALPAEAVLAAGAGVITVDPQQWAVAATAGAEAVPQGPPQVALVVDEQSLAYLSPAGDLQAATLREQARLLHGSDLTWEALLLPELPAARDYPLYLMAATYLLPEQTWFYLQPRLQAPGATALFVYAAGSLEGFIDASAMHRRLGLRTTVLGSRGSLRVTIPPGDPLFSADRTSDLTYGPRASVSPRFVIIGGEETFGRIEGASWAGLARHRAGDGFCAYSVAPAVPPAVLEGLLRSAQAWTTTPGGAR